MSTLLFFHILLLGLWGGCIAVEGVLEFAASKDPSTMQTVGRLHYWIDIVVEIPAFMGVLITGLLMLNFARLAAPMYLAKITLGSFAILVNVLCVIPVCRRRGALDANDLAEVKRRSRQIYFAFGVGVPAGFAALLIGMLGLA